MTYIYAYNEHSKSAKQLSHRLDAKRIKHENSRFRGRGKSIINWGCNTLPIHVRQDNNILNDPTDVARCTNKLSFFQLMEEKGNFDYIIPFTTDKAVVREWLQNGKTVMARTILSGHSGAGIVVLVGVDAEIVEAPLYTLYKPKKEEYRVHVARDHNHGDGYIFDIQKKMRRLGVPNNEINWKIRNLDGGFIYARENVVLPQVVSVAATEIFNATGLDFGAMDIIYNEHENKAYVLEINTAPGLSGTTLDRYVEMFIMMIGE